MSKRIFPNKNECVIRNILPTIQNKWAPLILIALKDGSDRFSNIKARIEGLSSRLLTQQLKTLVRDGYITRKAYQEIPPRVEYQLTQQGIEACSLIVEMIQWCELKEESIRKSRENYDLEL